MSPIDSSVENGHLEELLKQFPTSPEAERRRFLKARKYKLKPTVDLLSSFFEWRKVHELDLPENDCADVLKISEKDEAEWKYAARKATKLAGEKAIDLPQLAHVHLDTGAKEEVSAKNGTRIIHFLPAQLDTKIAPAATYGLAVAFYLDRKCDRNSMEKVTIALDVRPGQGWANPSAYSLLPFIKQLSSTLNANFPERLDKLLLFPMPTFSLYIWNMAKVFLDKDSASKVVIINSSAASIESPPPNEKLEKHIEEPVLKIMEDARLAKFINSA